MSTFLWRSLATAAFAFVLASCAGPQISHHQLSVLDKGLTRAEVASRLKLTPMSAHTASAGGRSFEFNRYRMNNGLHTDSYLLAYEQGGLIYWGYVSDFRRQPDADLNRALSMALSAASASAKP